MWSPRSLTPLQYVMQLLITFGRSSPLYKTQVYGIRENEIDLRHDDTLSGFLSS